MPEVLSVRRLNRALLARQALLAREDLDATAMTARLVGLRAQEPASPFVGLWSRTNGFRRDDLLAALGDGRVVRGTAMRGTIHLLTAEDYARHRMTLQPVVPEGPPDELVRRYLAAFGPSTAADATKWSGLTGMRAVLGRLEGVVTFEDRHGRTLFDLQDAPRPAEDVAAPGARGRARDGLSGPPRARRDTARHRTGRRCAAGSHGPGATMDG